MFKKAILLAFLCLCVTAQAQDTTGLPTTTAGVSYGVFMGQGIHPTTGQIINGQVGVKTLTHNVLSGWEISGFKARSEGSELNVVRTFLVKDVQLGHGFLAGVGAGGWDFINTNGNDTECGAFTGRFSYWRYGVRASLGGDVVLVSSDQTPDRFFVFANLSVGL